MKKLSIANIVITSVLIAASVFAIFYVTVTPKANEAGLNPWALNGITPILLTDENGDYVQQQLIVKKNGVRSYYGNGDPVYIWQDASGRQFLKAFLVDDYVVKSGKTAYVPYDGTVLALSTIGSKAKFEYLNESDLTPVYEYDEEGNPVYAYATNPSGLYLFDTDSPWEADAKDKNGNAITDASLLGQTKTVAKPDGSGNMTFTVPSSLPGVAWVDLTETQKADYQTGGSKADVYKELAVGLYYYANARYIETDYSGFYSNCLTSNLAAGMNNMIDLNILELRTQGVYYRQDFRVERNIPLVEIIGLEGLANLGLELTCGERRYYDTSMDHTEYYRSKTAIINGEGQYVTDWGNLTGAAIASDVYRKQNLTSAADATTYTNAKVATDTYSLEAYQKCAHIIAVDTIKTAYVAFNTDTNLFEVFMEMDLADGGDSRAVANTIAGIRNGSGDQNAAYTDIFLSYQLWQNGYFKTWNQYEEWSGKAAGFDVSSSFDYFEVFLYGEDNVPLGEFINMWDDTDWATAKSKYASFID